MKNAGSGGLLEGVPLADDIRHMKHPHSSTHALIGLLLGMGAPLGYLALRIFLTQELSAVWIRDEIRLHTTFYGYLTLAVPFVLGLSGFVVGTLQDIVHEQKEKMELLAVKLKHLAITDELTGLYNRRHLLVQIESEIERANRYKRSLSILMLDIDNFKPINDQHGHAAGDLLLKDIAKMLSRGVRKVDIVGRYGGDEFLVILPESDLKAAQNVAERILKNVRSHKFEVQGQPLPITLSIGLHSFESVGQVSCEELIEKADHALLAAKRKGKNRVFSYAASQ